MTEQKPTSIDEYLEGVPEEQRAALERLRAAIRAAAPEATETISYQMPAFKDHGPLVSFAAFKNHLSFFVMSTAVLDANQDELGDYRTSKGTVQFQPGRPLPDALVKKLVKARIEENRQKKSKKGPRPTRPRHPMPGYIEHELEGRGLMDAYRQRPPFQQNDYVGWITQAKQDATRQKRLEQMLEELERGDVYMKMPYKSKQEKRDAP
jgi:uncharacterized protein YdhG (YjbR/CyaY superfamily)